MLKTFSNFQPQYSYKFYAGKKTKTKLCFKYKKSNIFQIAHISLIYYTQYYNPFERAEKLYKVFDKCDWFKLTSFVCNTGLYRPVQPHYQ